MKKRARKPKTPKRRASPRRKTKDAMSALLALTAKLTESRPLEEPLWSAGQVIGVLSLSSSQKRAFAPGDQLLARLLANCCTPPIERARLRRLAMTDDLTLAYNQRYLSPRVNEEIERARRSGQPL